MTARGDRWLLTRRGTVFSFACFGTWRTAVLHSGGQRPARPSVTLRQSPPQTAAGARRCPQAASRPKGGLRGPSRLRFLQRWRGCFGEVVAARSVLPSPSVGPSSTGEGRRGIVSERSVGSYRRTQALRYRMNVRRAAGIAGIGRSMGASARRVVQLQKSLGISLAKRTVRRVPCATSDRA